MGKISNLVGKMPFAGKSVVENAALEAICERTSVREKLAKGASAAGFLAVFAAVHGLQVKLGVSDMVSDWQDIQDGASVRDVAEMVVSTAYTAANTLVTYTQLEIAARVGSNAARFALADRAGRPFPVDDYDYTPHQPTTGQLVATSGGQAIFLAQYDALTGGLF